MYKQNIHCSSCSLSFVVDSGSRRGDERFSHMLMQASVHVMCHLLSEFPRFDCYFCCLLSPLTSCVNEANSRVIIALLPHSLHELKSHWWLQNNLNFLLCLCFAFALRDVAIFIHDIHVTSKWRFSQHFTHIPERFLTHSLGVLFKCQ